MRRRNRIGHWNDWHAWPYGLVCDELHPTVNRRMQRDRRCLFYRFNALAFTFVVDGMFLISAGGLHFETETAGKGGDM